jgi:hypothetical protein
VIWNPAAAGIKGEGERPHKRAAQEGENLAGGGLLGGAVDQERVGLWQDGNVF